nr:aldo/keto reductase [Holzapfeliella floricola]
MPTIPTVTLNNGVKMPQEGFGVFQIPDFDECKQAVKEALEVGYRLIDTAQIYQNESAVGQAIQESSVRREDIFITTKIWVTDYGFEETKAAVEKSMERLKTDYLDLVLLHQPFNDYYRAYQALEALYEAKKITSNRSFKFLSRPLY